jgi:hypothetical protein
VVDLVLVWREKSAKRGRQISLGILEGKGEGKANGTFIFKLGIMIGISSGGC